MATLIFQGLENVLYDIFMNPETKTIFEDSGYIFEGIKKLAGFLEKINLL